jgi:hypothetical protein
MRSTRAASAVARLNSRSADRQYKMVLTGTNQFKLRERTSNGDVDVSDAISLDDFVKLVDSMEPKEPPRITKSEAAFLKQLGK